MPDRKKDSAWLNIVVDASFEYEKQRAGISAILLNEDDMPIYAIAKSVKSKNSMDAELKAILFAIENIPVDGMSCIIRNDNVNAIKLLKGQTKAPYAQVKLAEKIHSKMASKNNKILFSWTRRTENTIADAFASLAMRRKQEIQARLSHI